MLRGFALYIFNYCSKIPMNIYMANKLIFNIDVKTVVSFMVHTRIFADNHCIPHQNVALKLQLNLTANISDKAV